jgi:hypothetical protein
MPIEPAAPAFPRHESLARFFGKPPGALVALPEVAALLGTSTRILRAILRAEGGRPAGDAIPWTEAAAYLFDAWPRAQILDTLGPELAHLVPTEFQLTRVSWLLPVFLVRAYEHQAATAWRDDPRVRASLVPNHGHARGVSDYVTDVLYNEIAPSTLAAFRDDPAFLEAYHYPVLD